MKNQREWKRRIGQGFSVFLVICMLLTTQSFGVLAETVSENAVKEQVQEGEITEKQLQEDLPDENAVQEEQPQTADESKTAKTQEAEAEEASASLANPVHHCTGEHSTDWSYIYFGSYPQSEVTDAVTIAEIDSAIVSGNSASDTGDDVWINGTKYRRIAKTDTNYDGYFGDSTYRYFKWERIKWRVLQNNGSDLFVVTDMALDSKYYNEEYARVTWESCTLRKWLNNSFFDAAFSSAEQEAILDTTVVNADNPYFGADGGKDTIDKVYLLSIAEATSETYGFCNDLLITSRSRNFKATTYANARGVWQCTDSGYVKNAFWWLRSPGRSRDFAVSVNYGGNVNRYGSVVDNQDYGVPVALHIDLSSDLWYTTDDGTSGAGGSIGGGVVSDISSDQAIIDEVKKYADDSDYFLYQAIMKSDRSEEQKFKLLNSLFRNHGITDPHEGIKYLSEVSSHRRDYLYLTTNENYCAFNWWYWLSCTTSGKLARGLLYADGLIFNFELASYMDWKTYANTTYPGVEKCKTMLKEFMLPDKDDPLVAEVASNSKKTVKAMKNAIKLNNLVSEASVEEIMDRVMNAKSQEEVEKYQEWFAEWMIRQTKIQQDISVNDETKLYLGTDGISKCLGYSDKIIGFSASTVQDVVDIINLENDIQHYMEYDNFLKSIYAEEDVSMEMRIAAYQLHDDIENGYFNEIKSILSNFIDMELGMIYLDKGMLKTYLESHGMSTTGVGLLGEALGTLSLATVITNIVIDTGDFTKQAAYTSAYAELSTLYSFKLQEDKTAFLADPTAENAWKFYEDYNLLWRLRYKGEQQYLKMHEIKAFIFGKIKAHGYETKASVVQDVLGMLAQSKFELADTITVPKSVSYVKKMVIDCPVDVTVCTKSGGVIAVLQDGVLSDITNEYGRFAVVFDSYSEEYVKVICQSTEEDLDVTISAIDNGIVSYQYASADSENILLFSNLPVSKNDMITVSDNIYQITYNNGRQTDEIDLSEQSSSYVKPSELIIEEDSLNLTVGSDKVVSVDILPSDASHKDLMWYSEDETVATVKNGRIYAVAAGDTTVWVRACDGDELQKSITVHVSEIKEETENTHTHIFKWIIDKSATKDETGLKHEECTICGYKRSEGTVIGKISNDTFAPTPVENIKAGQVIKDNTTGAQYKVKDVKAKTVVYDKNTKKNVKTVTIPATIKVGNAEYKVVEIAKNAFKNNKNLIKVKGGKNVKVIGTSAFSGCKKLKSIAMSKNLTTIKDKAFYKCTSLTKITIPAKVIRIGKSAFYGCKKLKVITIKTGKLTTKKVGSKAFKGTPKNVIVKVPKKQLKSYKKWLTKRGINKKAKIKKF